MTSSMIRGLCCALIACGSKPPPDPAYAPAGPAPCERMADHVVGLMVVKDPATGKPVDRDQDTVDKITRLLISLCIDGKWSQDAQRCFATLEQLDDTVDRKCNPLLTVEQRDAFQRGFEAALKP